MLLQPLNAAKPLSALGARGILQNYISSFLADHINRADDKKSRDPRKHGRIHHPQTLRPINAELAVKHSVLLSRTNGATAGRMVSPGVIANVFPQIVVRFQTFAWKLFF